MKIPRLLIPQFSVTSTFKHYTCECRYLRLMGLSKEFHNEGLASTVEDGGSRIEIASNLSEKEIAALELAGAAAANLSEQAAIIVRCISGIIEQAEQVDTESRLSALQQEGNELIESLNRDIDAVTAVEAELLLYLKESWGESNDRPNLRLSELKFENMSFADPSALLEAKTSLRHQEGILHSLVSRIRSYSKMFRTGAELARIARQNKLAAASTKHDLERVISIIP